MLKTFLIPLAKSYAPNAIRHLGQLAAGGLLSAGLATADEATVVSGAVVALLSYGWSVVEKRGLLTKLFA
jgi:hypothetical protein